MFKTIRRRYSAISGMMVMVLMVITGMPVWADAAAGPTPFLNSAYQGKDAAAVLQELTTRSASRALTASEMADLGMAQLIEGRPALAVQTCTQALPKASADSERVTLHLLRSLALHEQAVALKKDDPARNPLLKESLMVAKEAMQLAPENRSAATAALGAAQAAGDQLEMQAISEHLARIKVKGEGDEVCDPIVTPTVVIAVVVTVVIWDMWRRGTADDRRVLMEGLSDISRFWAPSANINISAGSAQ